MTALPDRLVRARPLAHLRISPPGCYAPDDPRQADARAEPDDLRVTTDAYAQSPTAPSRRSAADSQRAEQATRSLSAITAIAIFVAASGADPDGRQHSFEIRTTSGGNPAVFSSLSPLAVPLYQGPPLLRRATCQSANISSYLPESIERNASIAGPADMSKESGKSGCS